MSAQMDGPMLSYGSQAINGQLVPEYTATAMFPSQAYIPYFQGHGAYTPTLPPPVNVVAGGMDSWTSGISGVGSGSVEEAADEPFNPIKSPVLWALGFLIVGILGLQHVHWKG